MLLSLTFFSPRLADTLAAGIDILNLMDNSVALIPNNTANKYYR